MDNDTIFVIGCGALMLITVAIAFIAVMVDPAEKKPKTKTPDHTDGSE